ncbi:hypothetical protein BGZ65_002029, partial [Modicella reniformis]
MVQNYHGTPSPSTYFLHSQPMPINDQLLQYIVQLETQKQQLELQQLELQKYNQQLEQTLQKQQLQIQEMQQVQFGLEHPFTQSINVQDMSTPVFSSSVSTPAFPEYPIDREQVPTTSLTRPEYTHVFFLNPHNPDRQTSLCNTGKRARNPLKVEKKIEIIEYAENNPQMTPPELAHHFRVPRTTIYGIIKKKETLLGLLKAALIPNPYRIAESRFWILEEVLMIWINDL